MGRKFRVEYTVDEVSRTGVRWVERRPLEEFIETKEIILLIVILTIDDCKIRKVRIRLN